MKDLQSILEQVKNKKLLFLFPHPDDETVMVAGLIQQALNMDWQVEVMCLTAGEAGQIHTNGNGRSLAEIRKEEMKHAMEILGVTQYRVLDFADGKLKQTKKWKTWLRDNLNLSEYGMVVSYGPTGVSGHPDHIATYVELKFQLTQIESDARPIWLWPVMQGKQKQEMVREELQNLMPRPDYMCVMIHKQIWNKWRALKAHASQGLGKKWWIPNILLLMLFRTEYFARWNANKSYKHKYVEFKI